MYAVPYGGLIGPTTNRCDGSVGRQPEACQFETTFLGQLGPVTLRENPLMDCNLMRLLYSQGPVALPLVVQR